MELVILERKSHLLTPSRLPCLGSLPTLRLASGCIHGCLDCHAQGSCGRIGSEKAVLADNLLKKLREELGRRRSPPPAVCFDFSSDPFQPVPDLLDRTYEVLEYLLGEGIGVVFQTKAEIPRRHLELLLAHPTLVRAIFGLVTIDRRLLRIFEPRTATPRTRLAQMRQLVAGGVATLARVDPILPGLSDDPDALHGLCAGAGRSWRSRDSRRHAGAAARPGRRLAEPAGPAADLPPVDAGLRPRQESAVPCRRPRGSRSARGPATEDLRVVDGHRRSVWHPRTRLRLQEPRPGRRVVQACRTLVAARGRRATIGAVLFVGRIIHGRVGGARKSCLYGVLREPVQKNQKRSQGFDSATMGTWCPNPPFSRRFSPRTLQFTNCPGYTIALGTWHLSLSTRKKNCGVGAELQSADVVRLVAAGCRLADTHSLGIIVGGSGCAAGRGLWIDRGAGRRGRRVQDALLGSHGGGRLWCLLRADADRLDRTGRRIPL